MLRRACAHAGLRRRPDGKPDAVSQVASSQSQPLLVALRTATTALGVALLGAAQVRPFSGCDAVAACVPRLTCADLKYPAAWPVGVARRRHHWHWQRPAVQSIVTRLPLPMLMKPAIRQSLNRWCCALMSSHLLGGIGRELVRTRQASDESHEWRVTAHGSPLSRLRLRVPLTVPL